MLISRSSLPAAPQAPPPGAQGGGQSPSQFQIQMPQPVLPSTPQMPYVQAPYVQTPQMPYVQGGGGMSTPQMPQLPSIPQPQLYVPPATITASSSNLLLYGIIALVCFLVGVGITILVLKH